MVLAHYGLPLREKDIINGVSSIKKGGTLTISNAQFARKQGFTVACFTFNKKKSKGKAQFKKPSKSLLVNYLKRGIPPIVVVRSALLYNEQLGDAGHYIVLTDFKEGRFHYNDPHDGKKHSIDEDSLLFAWYPHTLDSSAYLIAIQPKKKSR